MSAFLVSNTHINTLLTFAMKKRVPLPPIDDANEATRYGRELLRENLRSLAYRYGERHGFIQGTVDDFLAAYHFRSDYRAFTMRPGAAVSVIKGTHCYDYQACETPDYFETWAAAVMRNIRDDASHYLPGYDSAPWGFEEEVRA